MKLQLCFVSGVALATLATAGEAQAASVTVNNFSFETPSTPNFSPVITGWTVSSGSAGVQPFNATQFPSGVPDGSQAGLIAFNGGSIYQDVAATYQARTRYTLNLFAGIRLDEPGNLTLPNSTISLRRSDNNTVLSSFTFNQSSFSSRGVFLYHFSLFVADILLLSPKKGEGLGVRELTISAITLEKWYYRSTLLIWRGLPIRVREFASLLTVRIMGGHN